MSSLRSRSLVNQAREQIAEIRQLVDNLRPRVLDQLGLAAALTQLAERLTRSHGPSNDTGTFQVTVTTNRLGSLPAAVEVAAYRIVSEAAHNAARHGDARHCTATLNRGPGMLEITIDDDGRGAPDHPSVGVGLQSMSERADEVGGTLQLSVAPTGGMRVHARLPLTDDMESPI